MADDISAAFRWVLYHPRCALVFGCVLKTYLIIPTALIFGAKNSPSLYMILAEVRAHVAAVLHEFDNFTTSLAANINVPKPLEQSERDSIVQATPDSYHSGIATSGGDRHPSFVGDKGNAGIASTIAKVINHSVVGSYILFGFPGETPYRPPVINPTKWCEDAPHQRHYLSFSIDARAMKVSWPIQEREKLANMIDQVWLPPDMVTLTARQGSQLLGLIRNGALVSVFGVDFSPQMQYSLTDALHAACLKIKHIKGRPVRKSKKRWWSQGKVQISVAIIAELTVLSATLLDPADAHIWECPIGHLVERDPTLTSHDDASYSDMGGHSLGVKMMWHLSK
jgi:hypothetical protein